MENFELVFASAFIIVAVVQITRLLWPIPTPPSPTPIPPSPTPIPPRPPIPKPIPLKIGVSSVTVESNYNPQISGWKVTWTGSASIFTVQVFQQGVLIPAYTAVTKDFEIVISPTDIPNTIASFYYVVVSGAGSQKQSSSFFRPNGPLWDADLKGKINLDKSTVEFKGVLDMSLNVSTTITGSVSDSNQPQLPSAVVPFQIQPGGLVTGYIQYDLQPVPQLATSYVIKLNASDPNQYLIHAAFKHSSVSYILANLPTHDPTSCWLQNTNQQIVSALDPNYAWSMGSSGDPLNGPFPLTLSRISRPLNATPPPLKIRLNNPDGTITTTNAQGKTLWLSSLPTRGNFYWTTTKTSNTLRLTRQVPTSYTPWNPDIRIEFKGSASNIFGTIPLQIGPITL